MKTIFAIGIALMALSAAAQQDITALMSNAQTPGATTNSTVANGSVGWNIDQIAVIGCSIVGTNASPTNAVTVLFDASVNGTDWATSQYTFSITPNGTNAVIAISRLTNTVGAKWIRFGSVQNPNLTAVTISRFVWQPKE